MNSSRIMNALRIRHTVHLFGRRLAAGMTLAVFALMRADQIYLAEERLTLIATTPTRPAIEHETRPDAYEEPPF